MATDQGRLVAIISYGTLIGWLIALLLHQQHPTRLGRFHLRQTLGLYLSAVLVGWIPAIGWLLSVGLLVLWVLGLAGAIQERAEPVPLLGKWYQQVLGLLH
jgi:uncharacterized membrane protein